MPFSKYVKPKAKCVPILKKRCLILFGYNPPLKNLIKPARYPKI